MNIRRPKPPPLSNPDSAGDVSSPINFALSSSGAVIQPDALTIVNQTLTAANIFAGVVWLATINITPTVVKQAGNGTVMLWTSSHWICTVTGNAQFQTTLQSPSGVNEVVSIGPASSYSAAAPSGPEYNIITFAANAIPIARLTAGVWAVVISKFAGTATILPNALGAVEKGNIVVGTLG